MVYHSLKQAKAFAEQNFDAIEAKLGSRLANFKFYTYHDQGFWQGRDYTTIKEEVLESFVIMKHGDVENVDPGRRVAYLIDEKDMTVYLNITSLRKDPEAINWQKIKHFKDWAETVTPVDEAIKAHRLKRKMERQGKPPAKWWQFWLIK